MKINLDIVHLVELTFYIMNHSNRHIQNLISPVGERFPLTVALRSLAGTK
jgi:hypothetical protein